ncbi:MAG: 3TM-type holin [Rhodospirillaceae bacterium]|jgi:hypothetical protein
MLAQIAGSLVGPVTGLLDKFIEDKDQKNALAHEIATLATKQAHEAAMAQAQANVESAKHSSLFVAGARPAIMWICALGLMTNFFLLPLAEWGTAVWAPQIILPDFDQLQSGELMTLTLSLLGLGGMRSWEKSKGVARSNLKQ